MKEATEKCLESDSSEDLNNDKYHSDLESEQDVES